MSFIKTLATLAVGFAAAKGAQKFQQAGGLNAMKDQLRGAGAPGGMADQVAAYADKLGVPGGGQAVRDFLGRLGPQTAQATEQAEAGLGSLMGAMSGAAAAGARNMGDMLGALTGATPLGAVAEDNARLMIRAMIQAAKADGVIDAEERATILSHLSEATPEEIAFVEAELDGPADLQGLVAATGESAKAQVYSAALMVISVDTDAEKTWLRSLAGALALDAGTVAAIHNAAGKPLV